MILVFFFLDLDGNIVQDSLQSVVIEKDLKKKVITIAQEVVSGLFIANMSGALIQAAYTWILLDFFGVKCVYLYSLTAALIKTVPFASTSLVGVVAAI